MHSGPIADLSPALHTLLFDPKFTEAESRKVNWPDVNKDTFVRLCEFAYMQDYTPPAFRDKIDLTNTTKDSEPVSRPGNKYDFKYDPENGLQNAPEEIAEDIPKAEVIMESALEEEPAAEPVNNWDPVPREEIVDGWDCEPQANHEFWDDWASWSPLQRKRKEREAMRRGIPPRVPLETNSVRKLPIRGGFISDSQAVFTKLRYTSTNKSHQFNPVANKGPTQDFTAVFLGHAELYVLADKYGIEPLWNLVLYKLHWTLTSFTIHETDVAAIMEFVRFTYQNTYSDVTTDMLRNLATRYIVSILGQIGDRDEFKQLLAEGGDFVTDFWRIIRGVDN